MRLCDLSFETGHAKAKAECPNAKSSMSVRYFSGRFPESGHPGVRPSDSGLQLVRLRQPTVAAGAFPCIFPCIVCATREPSQQTRHDNPFPGKSEASPIVPLSRYTHSVKDDMPNEDPTSRSCSKQRPTVGGGSLSRGWLLKLDLLVWSPWSRLRIPMFSSSMSCHC